MCVESPVDSVEVVSPDVGEQFVSGESNSAVFDEIEQQFVFLGRKIDPFRVDRYGPGCEIYQESLVFICLVFVPRFP